jgi:multiple sugar transport system permease protein
VGPFLAIFAFALIAPVGYAIYLSLFRNQLVGGTTFTGLGNYHQALTDPSFWDSVRHVTTVLVVQVPIMLALAMFAALALDSARLRWTPLYRLSIFLPYAVPAVVTSLMWGFMYGSQFGLVASLSNFLGVHLPDPFASSWVLASIGNIVTWEFVGYNMLIFYSALRSSAACNCSTSRTFSSHSRRTQSAPRTSASTSACGHGRRAQLPTGPSRVSA